MRAGVADQRALQHRPVIVPGAASLPISSGARWSRTAATSPPSVSPVMVGADGASPQPTTPSADSIRTSRFSAVVIVIPAIFIGALSGKATGIASMRRTISGARSDAARTAAWRVRSSIIGS